jgi:hypothetical protein
MKESSRPRLAEISFLTTSLIEQQQHFKYDANGKRETSPCGLNHVCDHALKPSVPADLQERKNKFY